MRRTAAPAARGHAFPSCARLRRAGPARRVCTVHFKPEEADDNDRTRSGASASVAPTGDAEPERDARLVGFPAPLDFEIARMAVPSLASVVMDPLLGMVDTAIMGHLGGKVLAGVGLGSILCGSTNWIFGFLSVLTIPKVAQAVARDKPEKARQHIAQGLWVGLTVGLATMTAVLCFAPNIVNLIGGDPEMMAHAVDYMRARCLGNPFVLFNFVMIGTFRGIKDARTPLYAAVLANISNLTMDILFVYGLGMGAGGAALATSLSQMLSCAIMFKLLVDKKFITWANFKRGPVWKILRPFLAQGAAVSLRTMTVVGVIMASTSVLARVSSISQAAHEIVRQLWILLFQFVECINISNQSIVATAFGAKDPRFALAVVKRHIVYAAGLVSAVVASLLLFQTHLFGLFTTDSAVIGMAASVFPFVAALFPFDATVSILDGTLTAAGQATWTAKSTTVTSAIVLACLLSAERFIAMDLLRVWLFLKSMTLIRLPMLLHRVLVSEASPFDKVLRDGRAKQPAAALDISMQPAVAGGTAVGGSAPSVQGKETGGDP